MLQKLAIIFFVSLSITSSAQKIQHYNAIANKDSIAPVDDGFSIEHNWHSKTHLAIDEGPIVTMIENYRTGLIWKLFMNIPDVQNGLKKLGFTSPWIKNNN